ncbi:MAG: NADPH-dependent glutamate synthase [Deltaproteobacteria bacterium]|nr:NADPH-dependent glutamate synthase [Deltaproteobacteria bacterium]
MYSIVRRESFSEGTFLWEVLAPDVARAALPGHFVMLRLHEGGERIPLTVADFDRARGTITMVIQALGKTTIEMRDRYREGDTFEDFAGPLGLPQHIASVGHVVLVGGGLGVAPVFPQLRAFKEAGNRTTAIVGFRRQDLMFWSEKFEAASDQLIVCTDDGSYGRPGFVTSALREVLDTDRPDLVVAIGPLPMMHACAEVTRPYGIRTMVSLNAIMVDGTGMCGSCRVSVGGKVQFACVDGPDFDAHAVDFGELNARQIRFKVLENVAKDDYAHVCNLEQQLFREGKRSYKKLREVAPEQNKMPERDAHERVESFQEVNLGYATADALAEAERCIQCKIPTCIAGCPVSIDIPRFIRHLLVRDVDGALEVINESNLFPSICGRVCPQETQCESQCIIGKKMAPVAIGRLERFVGDHARPRPARPRTGASSLGRVAIVGSGPAGLAAAADLVRYGAEVTVFEALHVVGGVLRYGIPAFRLPREIIDREIKRLEDLGVRFETNKVIGKTWRIDELLKTEGYDAVFVGAGAGAPSFLGIPGEFAGQVYSANEFLTRVNLMGGERFPYLDTPIALGKKVVVIGAGNTAMDCLRVARRLGVPVVRCVYRRSEAEAPARIEELRHAREEGVEFLFLHSPVEIKVNASGDVHGMRVQKMELGAPDARGRRRPVPIEEYVDLDCDTVIYALGTKANPIIARSTPGLALNEWGYIVADEVTQATSLPGVFGGGDIVTGGATVILAMGAGRRAARAMRAYLSKGARTWPVTREEAETHVAPHAPSANDAERGIEHEGVHERSGEGRGHSCPKCRQPLEGDESYVCCRSSVLSWKCSECAKVSEGFAFPYGLCPMCGGALELLGERDAPDDDRALQAIRTAFEIELGGRLFYERAARVATDGHLRDLFSRFREMETEHMETLCRRYHVEAPEDAADGYDLDRIAARVGVAHVPEDPQTLFEIAIGLERRAVAFFEARGGEAEAGSPEVDLYQELAAEEREHVALLSTELERWKEKRPGLLG